MPPIAVTLPLTVPEPERVPTSPLTPPTALLMLPVMTPSFCSVAPEATLIPLVGVNPEAPATVSVPEATATEVGVAPAAFQRVRPLATTAPRDPVEEIVPPLLRAMGAFAEPE